MPIRTRHRALAAAAALGTVAVSACGGGAGPHAVPASKRELARAAAQAQGFTLVASGDVLPHAVIIRQAQADAGGSGYDFHKMLAGVKPVVSAADLAICHMETVYGGKDGPFTGYPTFKSPPQVAQALKDTGYDSCSTASNHTLDDGADGVRHTLDAMDAVGVRHAGSARTAAEAGRPALLKAGGATVAQLAYTYDTNGFPQPEGHPWAVNLIDPDRIIADARAARKAGADVVVVSLHWGTEWQDDPDEMQLTVGRQLTAARTGGRADIDLILGTHAHIPQAYEKVNGTWVVYGMGDQVAGQMFTYDDKQDARGNMGSIARFTFAPPAAAGQRWSVRKAEFIPQLMDLGPPNRVVTLNDALRKNPGRADYVRARDHIRTMVLSRGGGAAGLTMVP
ncbi:CapA family protein [Streptomyces sp. SPB162]|uniref:CapA family protein n=1 Tax=Streptomyces sp. SPB162 TaxID=2940560 RepID=UPI002404F5E5|nr:CapA family protein [Streptomyces sp. SPB162]MDF9811437.1 sugar phosphate isomerase/epimerase [Streptomyces sp. SPB162]